MWARESAVGRLIVVEEYAVFKPTLPVILSLLCEESNCWKVDPSLSRHREGACERDDLPLIPL